MGGSIPFIAQLANEFPKAIYLVTGAAQANCGEHCPNENLDIAYTKKFVTALSLIVGEISKHK